MSLNGDEHYWEDRFQDAALDPSQWLAVLGELADATGSTRGELIGIGGTASAFNWISALDASMVDDFTFPDGHAPWMNFRVAADIGTQPMQIVHEADYDRVRGSLRRDDYLDFCERHHMPFGCQTSLMRGNGSLVGLSVHRSRRDGRTTEAQRATFARAARGARLAVKMQRAIESQGFSLLRGSLEAMSICAFLIDGMGVVRAATPSAEQLLGGQRLLQLSGGRLRCSLARQERRIDRALRDVVSAGDKASARVALGQDPARPDLMLDFFRLPPRSWSMHFSPQAIVVVRRPHATRADAGVLAEMLSLTAAEAEVALALCDGQSRDTIAARRGVSPETVKAQVKSLYQKTGCHREAELVLLLRTMVE